MAEAGRGPGLPRTARIIERVEETPTIFTWRLRFEEPAAHDAYAFAPGQFNMLCLPGVGEIPISIVSDPDDEHLFDHTIRAVGRVTRAMQRLPEGAAIGVRGPFGRGWPLTAAEGRDLVIATGGLGCAPVVSVINYVLRRRERYGRLTIMQGVKHAADLIWRERYERWAQLPNTRVLLAASQGGPGWPWAEGRITALLAEAGIHPSATAMICGPEPMMAAVANDLLERGVNESDIWLSMERNMQCGVGQCGHCQIGPLFVCRDGPVFSYAEIGRWLGVRGV